MTISGVVQRSWLVAGAFALVTGAAQAQTPPPTPPAAPAAAPAGQPPLRATSRPPTAASGS